MILTTRNLTNYWIPDEQRAHRVVLGPILALHDALRLRRLGAAADSTFRWEWTSPQSLAAALPIIWRMTGEWGARRAVTIKQRKLESALARVVPTLARLLNRHSIASLWSLVDTDMSTYSRIVSALHDAVHRISNLRKTQQIEPVLGSKVLHHLFPSIVPAYDTALVRNGALRTEAFRGLLARGDEWVLYKTAAAAGGNAMLQFHRYFAMCAFLGEIDRRSVDSVRKRLGNGFRDVSPARMAEDRRTLLWRLDAKAAEYCLLGQARREDVL